MIIRKIQKKDMSQLSYLYKQFWDEDSNIEAMENELSLIEKEGNSIILVCEIDGTVIGSVMGVICRELYGDCKPFMVVEDMIVDKNCRHKGVGSALINELTKIGKEHKCTQMILVTEKNRHDACSFYEKNGFSTNTTGYKKKL